MIQRRKQLARDGRTTSAEVVSNMYEAGSVLNARTVSVASQYEGNATVWVAGEIGKVVVPPVLGKCV